jgi:hypothetical protein
MLLSLKPYTLDPITEFEKLYNNLPDADKDFYPDYLEPEDLMSLSEDQLLRHYAVIHVIFPRFYEMLHLAFTQIIAHYNGSAQGTEFVELVSFWHMLFWVLDTCCFKVSLFWIRTMVLNTKFNPNH